MSTDACEATIYSPDPQQCGSPADEILDGEHLCTFHAAAARWAADHSDDPDPDDAWAADWHPAWQPGTADVIALGYADEAPMIEPADAPEPDGLDENGAP